MAAGAAARPERRIIWLLKDLTTPLTEECP